MKTLLHLIVEQLAYNDEIWGDVIAHTLTQADLTSSTYSIYGMPDFTLWTTHHVYYVERLEDGDTIQSVRRNPPEK